VPRGSVEAGIPSKVCLGGLDFGDRGSILAGFVENLAYLYKPIITISTSLYRSGDGDDRKGGSHETSSG